MKPLPFNIQIESGALKIDHQTIFLRNVTSTKIEIAEEERKMTALGAIIAWIGIILGLLSGIEFDSWFFAILLGTAGFTVMIYLSRKLVTYVLIVVTSAGEVRALTSADYGALQEIGSAITLAIATL